MHCTLVVVFSNFPAGYGGHQLGHCQPYPGLQTGACGRLLHSQGQKWSAALPGPGELAEKKERCSLCVCVCVYTNTCAVIVPPSGQVSDGGVHSHINHLEALLAAAKGASVPHSFVHFFSDGRDTGPVSGGTCIHAQYVYTLYTCTVGAALVGHMTSHMINDVTWYD